MRMLLRSLSRNESSVAGNDTLVKDIEEYENGDELIESRQTVADYISVLDSLYLICNQEAYSINAYIIYFVNFGARTITWTFALNFIFCNCHNVRYCSI